MNKEQNKLITIIVPMYNIEQYIEKCVCSLKNQTYKEIEILLINDGSEDGTQVISEKYVKSDSRIRLINLEHKGTSICRNIGIKEAKGEYIAFVDGDDTVSDDYIEFLYRCIQNSEADISVCKFRYVYKDEDVDFKDKKTAIQVYSGLEALGMLLYQQYFISSPCAKLCKKSLYSDILFPEGMLAEDVATIYKLFAKADKVCYCNAQKYYYYQRAGSSVNKDYDLRNKDYLFHCNKIVEYVLKSHENYYTAAISRRYSACCQILSETSKKSKLYEEVIYILKNDRKIILEDRNARRVNRIAALLSGQSLPILYYSLRKYRNLKERKIR